MSLLDKVKNLFTDEEIIEEDEDIVDIREVKKEEKIKKESEENKLPTFMREKIEEEKKNKVLSPQPDFALNGRQNSNDANASDIINKVEINDNGNNKSEENSKFKFPIELEESDFIETRSRSSRKNAIRTREEKEEKIAREKLTKEPPKPKEPKVAELYKDKKPEKKKEVKKFKATPIISPVYGVLDKNYQVEEIAQNTADNFERQRPSKNVDFDSVRKKAYGSLADDIKENLMCENCEYLKEVKECRNKNYREYELNDEDDLMYDILSDDKEEKQEDITLETATENYYDYGVEYEPISTADNYLDELEEYDEEIREEVPIVNTMDEYKTNQKIKEVPPVKSKINLLSTLKKSAGDNVDSYESKEVNPSKEEKKDNSDLELTDDLFSIIDSMYEERND